MRPCALLDLLPMPLFLPLLLLQALLLLPLFVRDLGEEGESGNYYVQFNVLTIQSYFLMVG